MAYEFVLKFKLPEGIADMNELVERLGENGCGDALVGTGRPGRIALNFTRDADSAQQAFISALEDVRGAIPDAELIEVSPDLADQAGSDSHRPPVFLQITPPRHLDMSRIRDMHATDP
jgi:hypothetical protein